MEVFLPDFLNTLFGWILSLLGKSKIKAEHQTRYEELRYKTAEALTMYANYYSNPLYYDEEKSNEITVNNYRNASEEVRKTAAEVAGYIGNCPFFIDKEKLKDVKSYLIGISNSFFQDDKEESLSKENKQMVKNIKEILEIK